MIRGIATFLLLIGLLASLLGTASGPTAPENGPRIKAEALLDTVLRRADFDLRAPEPGGEDSLEPRAAPPRGARAALISHPAAASPFPPQPTRRAHLPRAPPIRAVPV